VIARIFGFSVGAAVCFCAGATPPANSSIKAANSILKITDLEFFPMEGRMGQCSL
jgi:hypothetical protein